MPGAGRIDGGEAFQPGIDAAGETLALPDLIEHAGGRRRHAANGKNRSQRETGQRRQTFLPLHLAFPACRRGRSGSI
jgi:protein involved in polysaccharide export with SLBB domain